MADQRGRGRPPTTRPHVAVAPLWRGAAGAAVPLQVRVTNRAPHDRILLVAALGVDPAWQSLPQQTGVLAPGASQVVELTLQPPPGTLPASYPLVVSAQSIDPATGRPAAGETQQGMGETTVVVNPRARLSVELAPSEVRAISSHKVTAVLRNAGGAPAQVTLSVTHPRNGRVSFRKSTVVVPAEGEVRIKGRARLSRPRLIGYGARSGYAVTATSRESVRHAQGVLEQKTVIGPIGLKIAAFLGVVGIWMLAAIVLFPLLQDAIRDRQTEQAEATLEPGDDGAGAEDGAGDGAAGEDGGEDGAGGAGGAAGEAAAPLQLTGSVTGTAPSGVDVQLEPKALVDEEAQGGTGIGVDQSELTGSGLRNAAADTDVPATRENPRRSVETADDGSYAFPEVSSPGYYLLTFSKPGYQTQRYMVDSSSEVAGEPLEVELAPGDGELSGRIAQPGGPGGGASVTISDGVNTLTTSSVSGGPEAGRWSITGLSTPGTYVVSATKRGMSSEAKVVDLAADGTATVDLSLQAGVALLTGTVEGLGVGEIGGATITVSDNEDDVRTVSSLTVGQTGRYIVPSVPAPGSYTVSIAAEGYQAQTHQLELEPGQSAATLDAVLTSASGGVSGVVSRRTAAGRTSPLGAVGITLTNPEHTYKTVSADVTGDYGFTGVTPGIYSLTAQYFGLETRTVLVEVAAGGAVLPMDLTLGAIAGGVAPRISQVQGSVLDAVSGEPIDTCTASRSVADACIEAWITPAEGDDARPDDDSLSTTLTSEGTFTLPDVDDCTPGGAGAGSCLGAGLYRLTVAAPGYQARTVDVQVRQGLGAQQVSAIELTPVPTLSGLIKLVDTVPAELDRRVPNTCVWVRSTGSSASLPTCAQAITNGLRRDAESRDDACLPAQSLLGREIDPDRERWCVVGVAARNGAATRFAVEVPQPGAYTVTAVPVDSEYLAVDSAELRLDPGDQNYTISLNRLGRVDVTVKAPEVTASGSPRYQLAPAAGVPVYVTPTPATYPGAVTDSDGNATLRGLPPGTYTISSVSGSNTGIVEVDTEYDRTETTVLRLTDPISSFVGKVVARTPVDGALAYPDVPARPEVSLTGPVSVEDASSSESTAEVTADDQGCFAVQIIDAPPLRAGCTRGWTTGPGGSLSFGPSFVSDTMDADVDFADTDAYDDVTFDRQRFDPNGRTDLVVLPRIVRGDIGGTFTPSGPGSLAGAQAVVTGLDEGRSFTVPLSSDGAGGWRFDWADTAARAPELTGGRDDDAQQPPDAGYAVPGDYEVRVTVPGYAPKTFTVTCAVGGVCSGGDRAIQKRGVLEVTVTSSVGVLLSPQDDPLQTPRVAGARVTALVSGQEIGVEAVSNGNGVATLSGIDPSDASKLTLRVAAPGHNPGTTVLAGTGLPRLKGCSPSAPGQLHTPSIAAGGTASCLLELDPLGVVDGRLQLVDSLPSAPRVANDPGAGVVVTVKKCTSTSCQSTEPLSLRTVRTDASGRFRIVGTADNPGLAAGTYVLTTSVPFYGYSAADAATGGRVVTVVKGQTVRPAFDLYVETTDLTVSLLDGLQRPVDGADVVLSRDAVVGNADDQPAVAGAPGTYVFDPTVPGEWTIFYSGTGLVNGSQDIRLVKGSSGNTTTVYAMRAANTVDGTVTISDSGAAAPNASVSLECTGASTACPDGAIALSTQDTPLETTTDGSGTYTLAQVPDGTYDLVVTLDGFDQAAPRPVTVAGGVTLNNQDVALDPQQRTVSVTVTGHDAEPLGGLEVTLTPLGSTPGSTDSDVVTSSPSPLGTATLEFADVRPGCYDITIDQAEGHLGTVTGPAETPTDPAISCPDGVTVPTGDASQTYSFDIDSRRLSYSLIATPVTNHPAPGDGTTLTVADGGGPVATLDVFGTPSGDLWLPPGSYDVTPSLAGVLPAFWPAPPQSVFLGGGETSGTAAFDLTEATSTATVTIPTLADPETAEVRVTPGDGQTAAAPAPQQVSAGGQVTFTLPSGSWVIEAYWSEGVGSSAVTVVEPDIDYPVTLTAEPGTEPTAPRGAPADTPTDPAEAPTTEATAPTAAPTETPTDAAPTDTGAPSASGS